MQQGPPLEILTRRLSECPPEFLTAEVCVPAVVSDLLYDLCGRMLSPQDNTFTGGTRPEDRNWERVVLVSAWLLHDPWFHGREGVGSSAHSFLAQGLVDLSRLVAAPQLVSDPDRREELARLCLKALGYAPEGETEAQAQDRLMTLSSAERQRVVREAQAAEARAREIREAMARKAAEEAAAHYARE